LGEGTYVSPAIDENIAQKVVEEIRRQQKN
jgi:hypothetical protein